MKARKKSRRENALIGHALRVERERACRTRRAHRIIVRVGDLLVIDSTIGKLRDAEIARDGIGNCVFDCTTIQL